jgi:methyltransferase OMS1, mitochondrial
MSRLVALAGGAVAGSIGLAVGYLSFARPRSTAGPPNAEERVTAYDRNASDYDSNVGIHESLSGISTLRRSLLQACMGNVLELAAGTGRNMAYYPSTTSITLVDMSVGMLAEAESKVAAMEAAGCRVRLVAADASRLPFSDASYDTVVDTFGLCSFDDPAAVLKEAARVLRPGGQLLLLEHGRGSSAWLNGLLDRWADAHARRHGCSWNRDVEALVRETATAAGLTVEDVSRCHLGTTIVLRCRRNGGQVVQTRPGLA